MGLVRKIKKKCKTSFVTWKSDARFSKRYANLRLKDTFYSTLHRTKKSNRAFSEREQFLVSFLKETISGVIEKYRDLHQEGIYTPNAKIWICWWTGLETAPPIVQQCIKSIYKNAESHPVILITQDNYRQYITVPEYILKKMKSKTMCLAHFADYLRVSLLEQYGGLWLDATMFCSEPISEDCFTLPFFTLKSPYRESRYASKYQWVTFCLGGWQGNQFYSFIREAFETYWSENDYAIDYLFFDYIILLARENCKYIRQLMDTVPENTPHRDDLQAAMNAALPAEQFGNVIQQDTGLYKLSWRETYSKLTPEGQQSIYGYFLSL